MLGDFMKIEIHDELHFVIYLNQYHMKEVNLHNKDTLEKYFKSLFSLLSKNYDIDVMGYYNITVYLDKYYGAVIELNKEDIDYLEYFGSQVDMRISIEKDSKFLYHVKDCADIDKSILKKGTIYRYQHEVYLKLTHPISHIEMGNLLEFSDIIYDDRASSIIKYGKVIYA